MELSKAPAGRQVLPMQRQDRNQEAFMKHKTVQMTGERLDQKGGLLSSATIRYIRKKWILYLFVLIFFRCHRFFIVIFTNV